MRYYLYRLDQIHDELVSFAVILTKFQGKYIIIKNRNRGGWEIPGGRREEGETILQTSCRELYEETGAVVFNIAPYGIFPFNETYGMAFIAEVFEIERLPDYEIEEIKLVNALPQKLNFDLLYHYLNEKLIEETGQLKWHSVNKITGAIAPWLSDV